MVYDGRVGATNSNSRRYVEEFQVLQEYRSTGKIRNGWIIGPDGTPKKKKSQGANTQRKAKQPIAMTEQERLRQAADKAVKDARSGDYGAHGDGRRRWDY